MALAKGTGVTGPNPLLGDTLSTVTSVWYALYFLAMSAARRQQGTTQVMFWSSLTGVPVLLAIAWLLRRAAACRRRAGGWAACAALGAVHAGGQGLDRVGARPAAARDGVGHRARAAGRHDRCSAGSSSASCSAPGRPWEPRWRSAASCWRSARRRLHHEAGLKTRGRAELRLRGRGALRCTGWDHTGVDIHLLDGTYELFRHFYAMPSARDADGREVGAVRGVLNSVLGMINGGARHVAVATDHVIESFRNRLWAGYKTGAGIDPDLLSQFPLLEDVAHRDGRDGVADGGVRGRRRAGGGRGPGGGRSARRSRGHLHARQGSGAVRARHPHRAAQSPHAHDDRRSRRRGEVRRAAGVDSRLPRARRRRRRRLPRPARLGREVHRGGARPVRPHRGDPGRLAHLGRQRDQPRRARAHARREPRSLALLFRTLATLRTDVPTFDDVDELEWTGPRPEFAALAARFEAAARRAGPTKRGR